MLKCCDCATSGGEKLLDAVVVQQLRGEYVHTWVDPELSNGSNMLFIVLHELVDLVSHHLKLFLKCSVSIQSRLHSIPLSHLHDVCHCSCDVSDG